MYLQQQEEIEKRKKNTGLFQPATIGNYYMKW